MTHIHGAAALVTGAANGIGRALALELAARGASVALADRDEAGLKAAAEEVARAHPRKVTWHPVDVSRAADVEGLAKAVVAEHPGLNIVVNNAGVALFGQFHEVSQADMEWLMGINFWGVVYGCRAFLPHLQRQPAAHIVNTSSIFGIIAPPGQTSYAAAKFAVRGFSEALRHELAVSKSPVRLTVVHPGGVATRIARESRVGAFATDNKRRAEGIERFEAMVQTSPQDAAIRIAEGIEADAPRVLIGKDARRMDLLQRFKPATYWATIAKSLERTVAKAMARKGATTPARRP
ncbi:MAG: SDR family oxidoreductase [Hyphomicrobiaceae bacterium]|nr:SDR family oxidoreductase [Hyphomicrobiaceae bacterium]